MNMTSWLLILVNALIWIPVYALHRVFQRVPKAPQDRKSNMSWLKQQEN